MSTTRIGSIAYLLPVVSEAAMAAAPIGLIQFFAHAEHATSVRQLATSTFASTLSHRTCHLLRR
jgi:hypothetical protein